MRCLPPRNRAPQAINPEIVIAIAIEHDECERALPTDATAHTGHIGRRQIGLFQNGCRFYEAVVSASIDMRRHAGSNVAAASNRVLDGRPGDAAGSGFIRMAVLVLTTDQGLIDLGDAHQFAELGISQPCPDATRHVERRLIAAEAHDPLNLQAADAFLAGEHQVNDLEPLPQTDVGILKNRIDQHGKPVAARLGAVGTLPVKRARADGRNLLVATSRASNAIRPAPSSQVRLAGAVIRKKPLPFREGHAESELLLDHRQGIP